LVVHQKIPAEATTPATMGTSIKSTVARSGTMITQTNSLASLMTTVDHDLVKPQLVALDLPAIRNIQKIAHDVT
tara:strand:- start:6 stop:227 length:222 start_codon:yes stop_codon:yes gene_type:complete